jgi:hypothetical protein
MALGQDTHHAGVDTMFDEHALRRVRLLASMYAEAGRRDGRDDDEIRRALMSFGEEVAAEGDLDPWSEEVLIAELGRALDGAPDDRDVMITRNETGSEGS